MRTIKLDKLSDTITRTIKTTNKEIKGKKFDYYEYIFTIFLKRYIYILYGINELLPMYKDNKSIIITLSPLLRMGLSDFISQCFILSAIDINKEFEYSKKEYEKRVEQLLFHSIVKEINLIEKQKQDKSISNEEYKKNLKTAFNFSKIAFSYFNEDNLEYKLKTKDDISPSKMFRIFSNNIRFKQYNAVYPLYDYFSKMEHFGGFSNMIDSLEYVNKKGNTDRIIHSVLFISKGIEFCIENIESVKQENILKELNDIATNFIKTPLDKNYW